ncbi:hypothetical protein GUITHDRAFT_156716 [Guillardia theta CCMP2712]|uniref:Uncharacterized protein n=1 Tax=Guillardia theta (strain CCMP2712) TaxID=905079 RepID=L1I3Y4_GUITC|nr:hypothetical protein GUITHDRAFT_156716 [Guillardia theta CCMP2712]EKX30941.1 hypothetical protein GUITHDRAFT_156716 [Guillardia theta CCMP2712]|eukprot:XP_005817921.1 hypothetical protein GUITHDRAFT_156716 [Guillardia theta CCMP2712]
MAGEHGGHQSKYDMLVTMQAVFASSFGAMMIVDPVFFEFISRSPFDLHAQDCIRVCGPFVVLLGIFAYRTRTLTEEARRAFSQTCLISYSLAVILCLCGYYTGRWNLWLIVCAMIFTGIGVVGHGAFGLFVSPGGCISRK